MLLEELYHFLLQIWTGTLFTGFEIFLLERTHTGTFQFIWTLTGTEPKFETAVEPPKPEKLNGSIPWWKLPLHLNSLKEKEVFGRCT